MTHQDLIDATRSDLVPAAGMIDQGKWLVWETGKSDQTLSKFVDRAKRAGFTAFCRGGRFGILASDLEG